MKEQASSFLLLLMPLLFIVFYHKGRAIYNELNIYTFEFSFILEHK
jgi:hypothetical protein